MVLLTGCGRVVLRAVGAGHVEDDLGGLGVFLFGDGGEGAEELVRDVYTFEQPPLSEEEPQGAGDSFRVREDTP